jgi:ribose transport system ATP-binding protein
VSAAPAISVIDVTRRYPGVVALKGVTLDIQPGEVHAFVGQNGAGKSTLVKILSGAVEPSSGQILLRGMPTKLTSPADAVKQGIATMTQEMNLVPTLSVAENIMIGHLPWRRGRVDWAAMRRATGALLAQLGFDLDPDALVEDLPVAQRQGVEIARALSRNASIVIMDEPTSALAAPEIEKLLETVAKLKTRGTSVIYISHKMDEIFRICDRMSIFREGACIGTMATAATDRDAVVRMMVGHDLQLQPSRREMTLRDRPPVLEVEGLTAKGKFHDISFQLHPGEILGIGGLVGSGRTEVLRALFGADPTDAGVIRIAGEAVAHPRPEEMIARGMGLVPEDRRTQGLVLGMSIVDNISLADLARRSAFGLRHAEAERSAARELAGALSIRAPGLATPVATLSGGNQQKVAIGKWLRTSPRILLFDEPTRGIDIAAKAEILRIIEKLAEQGVGVVLVSSEQADLLEACDRILILREGRLAAEFGRGEATSEMLTQASFARLSAQSTGVTAP